MAFIHESRRRNASLNGVCNRRVVNDSGLGENSPSDFSTTNSTGVMIKTVSSPLTQGYDPLGVNLVAKLPGIGKMIDKIGGGSPLAPLIGAPAALTLDIFTLGLMRLPGISSLISGLFKKATEMESCMKWWTDSNIIGMTNGISLYSIDVVSLFPEAIQEYRVEHADSIMTSGPIASALNPAKRQRAISSIFLKAVRDNPDLMTAQCAIVAKSKGENTGMTVSQADVEGYWSQLKEAARQKEAESVLSEITKIMGPYQSVANQKTAAVVTTRQAGLVSTDSGGKGFQLPEGVMSISKGGSLILDVNKSTNRVIDYTVGKPTIKRI